MEVIEREIYKMLDDTGRYMLSLFKEELKLQGHYNTGRLDKSMEVKTEILARGFVITFLMEEYGIKLDTGVPAGLVPTSGAERAQWISGLADYFRSKGFGASSGQFAIRTYFRHVREGMPTKASYRFSKTGQRTGFIDAAYSKAESSILDKIDKLNIQLVIEDIISDTQKTIGK